MRLVALALASIALLGCGGGSNPLTGTWISQGSVVGSGWSLTLDQKYGNDVSGTGIARVEAGPSRSFTVTGSFNDSTLRATFRFDDGSQDSYIGNLSPSHAALTGTLSTTGGAMSELDFTRQQ